MKGRPYSYPRSSPGALRVGSVARTRRPPGDRKLCGRPRPRHAEVTAPAHTSYPTAIPALDCLPRRSNVHGVTQNVALGNTVCAIVRSMFHYRIAGISGHVGAALKVAEHFSMCDAHACQIAVQSLGLTWVVFIQIVCPSGKFSFFTVNKTPTYSNPIESWTTPRKQVYRQQYFTHQVCWAQRQPVASLWLTRGGK